MRGWGAAGLRVSVATLAVGMAVAGCSGGGKVSASGKPSPSSGSGTGPSSQPNVTVTQSEAAAVLKTYQGQNDAANAALDTAAMAKIESGSLLSVDQGDLIYDRGVGGARAEQAETPMAFTDPVFYPVGSRIMPARPGSWTRSWPWSRAGSGPPSPWVRTECWTTPRPGRPSRRCPRRTWRPRTGPSSTTATPASRPHRSSATT